MNSLYNKAKEKFLTGALNWNTDNIKISLVTDSYVVNLSTHEFVSDLSTNVIVTSPNLTGKSVTNGSANADNVTFTNLISASIVKAIVIFKDTGNPATSPLIAYMDTGSGLALNPVGGDVYIAWDTGPNKIFRI